MQHFFSLHLRKHLFEFSTIFLYLCGVSFMLMWPSLWNGYPLVFSDTGAYISSAFTLKVPFDRPIGYGYFTRLFSGGLSLWLVIFTQAFLVSSLLWKLLGIFLTTYRFRIHFLSVLFLSIFTVLPWFASQLMPDIFSGLIFLLLI